MGILARLFFVSRMSDKNFQPTVLGLKVQS